MSLESGTMAISIAVAKLFTNGEIVSFQTTKINKFQITNNQLVFSIDDKILTLVFFYLAVD